MNISNQALADAMTITGKDETGAAAWIADAFRKAVRTSDTGYRFDCWLLTVKNGAILRVRQHRVKVDGVYVSNHAINRANERFRVPKEEAARWLVSQLRRATFIAVTKDEKGNLGRTYAVDGMIIGMDMREPVITTVYPASIASLTLYRKLARITRWELRKAEWKLRIARALRLPVGRIEGLIREYKHVARSIPVHTAISRVVREA